MSNLAQGNKAFRNGLYASALSYYHKALGESTILSRALSFNIYIAKKRLRESDPCHPLLERKWCIHQNSDTSKSKDISSLVFDYEFYYEHNPDVAKAKLDAQKHYFEFGEVEGRRPNEYFDPLFYLQSHPDVKAKGTSPFQHYIETGFRECRVTCEKQGTFAKSRGTLILVTHDTEVGGAQHVLRLLASWLIKSTRFDVQIIALKGGNWREQFARIAPLLVLSELPESRQAAILSDWIAGNTVGVFVNSIASGAVLRYLPPSLPAVAFIHELPNVLDLYKDELELVRNHSQRVIGGGPDVASVLVQRYNFDSEKVYSSASFIEPLPESMDWPKRRRAARLALNVSSDRFIVLGCGSLHWRKAPDKFIEVAEHVILAGVDAEFIWIGGGPDEKKCNDLVSRKGLAGRVRFTGYEAKVSEKLAGGDLFLLSSVEDPFPLVALYAAQAGIPIVCFQGAGGVESFVAEGSGIATKFMNVSAMAEAVLTFAKNPKRRAVAGRIGQLQVNRSHTINVAGPVLLNHIRETIGLEPEVSVVVPNYNYEAYLPERLASIARQTFQDFEVILLDDASTDKSVELLQDFAKMRAGSQLLLNEQNSGSPFAQWIRGMQLARADLIWLAEADDHCTSDYLETMLPTFDDRNVRIASCASQPITAEGVIIGDYRSLYLDRIMPSRWDKDFIATDHEEASLGLGIANSIPNASAVIFRKFKLEPEFVRQLTSMRLCGDWYFYIRAMRGGLVGFSSKLMNNHRRHDNAVTHKIEGSLQYFEELAMVRDYICRNYAQSSIARNKAKDFWDQEVNRFNVPNSEALPTASWPPKSIPTLLMVTPDLGPGGGQVFSISVANEWVRKGGRVVLLNVGNQPSHTAMVAKIESEVTCIDAHSHGTDLRTLIQRFDIDVIHSCIWWADRWVDNHKDDLPDYMPWVITMHGCHETILQNPEIDQTFSARISRMIGRATWVFTATKNLKVFESFGEPKRLVHIPNGIAEEKECQTLKREDFGLRQEAIVLCLASRAISSKGWAEAVRLTERLNKEGHAVDLLLIGEGPAADLIRRYTPKHVCQLGQVTSLQSYLKLADIGLLPSYFEGESLPLVLLEMMAVSLPLVASDIGEVPSIIGTGEVAAGLVVPRLGHGIDEEALYLAVRSLMDPCVRHDLSVNARVRYENNFTIQKMVARYASCYSSDALS